MRVEVFHVVGLEGLFHQPLCIRLCHAELARKRDGGLVMGLIEGLGGALLNLSTDGLGTAEGAVFGRPPAEPLPPFSVPRGFVSAFCRSGPHRCGGQSFVICHGLSFQLWVGPERYCTRLWILACGLSGASRAQTSAVGVRHSSSPSTLIAAMRRSWS